MPIHGGPEMQLKHSLWQNHRPGKISSQSIPKMERNRSWEFLQILEHRNQNPQGPKVFQKIQTSIFESRTNRKTNRNHQVTLPTSTGSTLVQSPQSLHSGILYNTEGNMAKNKNNALRTTGQRCSMQNHRSHKMQRRQLL